MRESDVGRRVAHLLDNGLDHIRQGTLNRLESARRASLENYHVVEAFRQIVVGKTVETAVEFVTNHRVTQNVDVLRLDEDAGMAEITYAHSLTFVISGSVSVGRREEG